MLETFQDSRTQQQSMLSSMIEIAQAADGDFIAIDRLSAASSDAISHNLTIQYLARFPHCELALANHQPLGSIDLAALHQLPIDTLGYQYAHHMLSNQLKQLVTPPVATPAEFIDAHMRETHDIWHVVTDSPIGMLGEIKLQAFCIAQLQRSRFWMALLTKNLLKAAIYDIEVGDSYMTALTTGWTMGKAAQPLFGVDWQSMWAQPISQVRSTLNISVSEV
jgi:ubiquinone biosynthesis protein COQ4